MITINWWILVALAVFSYGLYNFVFESIKLITILNREKGDTVYFRPHAIYAVVMFLSGWVLYHFN